VVKAPEGLVVASLVERRAGPLSEPEVQVVSLAFLPLAFHASQFLADWDVLRRPR
jgi:hypothetical protein